LEINQRAVRARPDDALGQSQLGQSYYFLGRLDEAEKHLKEAKAIDPSHFSFPQLVLAELYQRRGNYPALVGELEEFLRLHPDSEEAPAVRTSLERVRARLPAP
jgi:tetratricopeptide (TPR) repeat protein